MTFLPEKYAFLRKIRGVRKWDDTKIAWVFCDENSFFFDEYGIVTGKTIQEHMGKIAKKNLEVATETSDISGRYKGLAAVGSFLGFVLDRIHNVFIGFRKDLEFIEIKTETWRIIVVTPEQEVLTVSGYKKAQDISAEDRVFSLHGSAFSFKRDARRETDNSGQESVKKFDDLFRKKDTALVTEVPKPVNRFSYCVGLRPDAWKIFKSDYEKWMKAATAMESGKEDIVMALGWTSMFGEEKVSSVVRSRKSGFIFQVMTSVAQNVIINNFVIKQ